MKVLFQTGDRFAGTPDDMAGGLVRPFDHDHRQGKSSRRLDLGVGRQAAGILGNEDLDLFIRQQAFLGGAVEWSASPQEPQIGWQALWIGRLDHTGEIVVLRRGGKGMQLLAAEAEKDAARCRSERQSGSRRRWNDLPAIASLRIPWRTHEGGEWHAGAGAGEDGVRRHLIGIGMRRVDDRIDGVLAEEVDEAIDTAEAADSRRDRLRFGRGRPAGERERRFEARVAGKFLGKGGRFRRAAEDEDAKSLGHDR